MVPVSAYQMMSFGVTLSRVHHILFMDVDTLTRNQWQALGRMWRNKKAQKALWCFAYFAVLPAIKHEKILSRHTGLESQFTDMAI